MRALRSALLLDQSTATWREIIVKMHSSYRCQIAINGIFTLHMNRFEKFLPVLSQTAGEEVSAAKSSATTELHRTAECNERSVSQHTKESTPAGRVIDTGKSSKIEHPNG